MTEEALDLWRRALHSLRAAEMLASEEPDSAASRAYYAAFHAVSALFALRGATYVKHSAVKAAVHRDLVRAGAWDTSLGESYSYLFELRTTGDYGGSSHVTAEEAEESVQKAREILSAVCDASKGAFPTERG